MYVEKKHKVTRKKVIKKLSLYEILFGIEQKVQALGEAPNKR